MKKLIILLFIALAAVTSCKKPNELTINKEKESIACTGGQFTFNITANCSWTVTSDKLASTCFSKTSGEGDATITVIVPENAYTSASTYTITVACGLEIVKTITVTQDATPAVKVAISITEPAYDFEGGTVKGTIESNAPWQATITEGFTIEPTSGEAGTVNYTVTVPANTSDKDIEFSYKVRARNAASSSSDEVGLILEKPSLEYEGVTYKVVKMKDGRWWMAENLRYLPEGMTPSNDLKNVKAGVYYPIALNAGKTAVEFSTSEDVIKSNGYLYQSEVALGLKVGDITTEDQAKKLNGVQGICPKGWHIPTDQEIIALVGKAVSPYETKTDAPYYDSKKANATIELLNNDSFGANAWGAVTIADNTKTAASLMGYLSKYPNIISSGYICGSSYTSKTEKEGVITNFQFLGFMPMANNGTFNGAKLSYRVGASVRCIKDLKK